MASFPSTRLSAKDRATILGSFSLSHASPYAPTNHTGATRNGLTPAASSSNAALRLRQSRISDEDETILVLCSLQTLLSPTQQSQFGPNGQPPAEGHFIALDPVNPRFPIFDKGFVFFPGKHLFRQTKDALASMNLRAGTIHGIDPKNAKLEIRRHEIHKKAHGDTSTIVTESLRDLANLLDVLFSAVAAEKLAIGAGTVLLVVEPKRLSEVKQALLWLQKQPELKVPNVCVKTIQEVFPDIDSAKELSSSSSSLSTSTTENTANSTTALWKPEKHRCALHPITVLNPYGNAFICCQEEARRMQHRVVKLSDAMDAMCREAEKECVTSTSSPSSSSGPETMTNDKITSDGDVAADMVGSSHAHTAVTSENNNNRENNTPTTTLSTFNDNEASAQSPIANSSSNTANAESQSPIDYYCQGPRHVGAQARSRLAALMADDTTEIFECPVAPDFLAIAVQRLREAGFLRSTTTTERDDLDERDEHARKRSRKETHFDTNNRLSTTKTHRHRRGGGSSGSVKQEGRGDSDGGFEVVDDEQWADEVVEDLMIGSSRLHPYAVRSSSSSDQSSSSSDEEDDGAPTMSKFWDENVFSRLVAEDGDPFLEGGDVTLD